jgi:hypothetical protein
VLRLKHVDYDYRTRRTLSADAPRERGRLGGNGHRTGRMQRRRTESVCVCVCVLIMTPRGCVRRSGSVSGCCSVRARVERLLPSRAPAIYPSAQNARVMTPSVAVSARAGSHCAQYLCRKSQKSRRPIVRRVAVRQPGAGSIGRRVRDKYRFPFLIVVVLPAWASL